MSERNYYVFCDDNCKFPAMTKEQTLTAIQQAVEEGTIHDVDTGFVTSIKESNKKNQLKFWVGTQAEYNAQEGSIPENTYCIVTDDTTANDIQQEIEALGISVESWGDEIEDAKRVSKPFTSSTNTYKYINIIEVLNLSELSGKIFSVIPMYTNESATTSIACSGDSTWTQVSVINANGGLSTTLPIGCIVEGKPSTFYHDGTNVVLLNPSMQDFGWTTIDLSTLSYSSANDPLKLHLKQSGSIVACRFSGSAKKAVSGFEMIATFPNRYRPSYDTQVSARTYFGCNISFFIQSNGYLQIVETSKSIETTEWQGLQFCYSL